MTEKPLQGIIIGLLLFTAIIVGGLNLFGTMINSNSEHIDTTDRYYESFSNNLNQTDTIIGVTDDMSQKIEDIGGEGGNWFSDFFGMLGLGGWGLIKNFGTSISFMNNMFTEAGKLFNIPPFMVAIIIAIISAVVIFTILRVIFNRDL